MVLKESVKVPPGLCQAGGGGNVTVVTGETSETPAHIRVTAWVLSSQMRFLLESNHRTYLPVQQLFNIFWKYF